jgi:hypothetical protein
MSPYIHDLTPFSADGCWMCVLLAKQANVGVILRRGPTRWWRVTLWDTKRDRFEGGQWFHGRICPEKCDVSPDGKLLVYFAGKWDRRSAAGGYDKTWTAVSRPPYLTALALWPIAETWSGRGIFLDNRTVLVETAGPSLGEKNHPNHPPGPLEVVEYGALGAGDSRRAAVPGSASGWEEGPALRAGMRWPLASKVCGDLMLGREIACEQFCPSRSPCIYTLYRQDGEPIDTFEAHWADWDRQGRLVATAGGRVLAGKFGRDRKLKWRQLAAMNEERPIRMEAPDWAQHW